MKKITFILFAMLAFCWQSNAQDTCGTATAVTPGTITGTLITQGSLGGQGDTGTTRDAAWFAYTATGDGTINISSCLGGADTRLYVFNDCAGTPIASDDDTCPITAGGSDFAAEITDLPVTSGTTYYIEWDDRWSPAPFDWSLEFVPPQPPANDACVDAIALTCFQSDSGSTDLGTDSDGNGDIDVWYTFDGSTTAAGDTVRFSLCGSGFDTIITVYDSCGGAVVDTNDDFCSLQSEVEIVSDGATTYVIAVEGFNGATGDYELSVICPALYPTTEANLTLDGCVDSDSYAVAYDGTAQSVVWVQLVYDGDCTEVTVDTETSDFDTEIGIYDALGNLVGNNDDGGTGTLSLFTELGLPAGTYFIAAGGFNTVYGPAYDVTSSSTLVGALVINASTPAPPAPATVASLSLTGCSDSDSYSATYDGTVDGIVWLELTYDGGCSEVTFDTLLSDFDTEIGLYDSNGFLLANNDDFGGPQSSITEAGLSAGTYYIALGGFNTAYSDGFDATTTNTQTGNLEFVASTPALSCTAAIFDAGTINDDNCNPDGTGGYTVLIDVAEVNDGGVFNDGSTTYPVVIGVVTAGPYPSGTSVTIEYETADPACNSTVGTFEFTCAQPVPENDLCVDAEAIGCGATVTGSTANATDTEGTAAPDVFYSISGTELNEEITVSLCGSSFDTILTVFDACGGSVETSNDDNEDCGVGSLQSEVTFLSDGLTSYIIRVEGFGLSSGDYELAVTCVPPPACTQAVIDSSTIVDACNPDGSGIFTIDHVFSVAGDAGTVLDDGLTTYPVIAGTVTTGPYSSGDSITIELTGTDPACNFTVGTFEFTCPPPAPDNDEISGAIDLSVGSTVCETSVLGTNVGATDSIENDNEASCSSFDPAGDVWFKVTVPSTGELTIQTSAAAANSITDTVMEVYSGTSGALVEIACSDDEGAGLFSLVELTGLTAGDVLLVRVWEFGDDLKGDFEICAWSPSSLGVEDNTFNGFSYFPNPIKDVLTLESPRSIDSIEVFNVVGQRIIAVNSNNTIQNIDMSNVQSGAYFVRVSIGSQTKTIKVLKD